jgi:hypothetical protein
MSAVTTAQIESKTVVFKARRPAALVYPLAALTVTAGILTIAVTHSTIGWFMVAAPAVALLATGVLVRPRIELTRDGILQRQYPFSVLTKWDVIDHFGLTRAGNREVLGYRLREGTPPPRRQPAAALLRAAAKPFDGGYFADSLAARSEDVLEIVNRYLLDGTLRSALPPARR